MAYLWNYGCHLKDIIIFYQWQLQAVVIIALWEVL